MLRFFHTFAFAEKIKSMATNANIKLAILDFDGTIANTQTLIVDTILGVIEELSLPKLTREQCVAMIGLPLEKTFSTLIPMNNEMSQRCAKAYERIYCEKNTPEAVSLFPHVYQTLQALHTRGTVLTIASSRHRWSLTEFVRQFKIDEFITYILGADDVTQAKPHPEPVLKTLQTLHFEPEETIVVGDTVYDIRMGQGAGAHTCGVTYGNGTREDIISARAEYIIDNFEELLEIIG